MQFGILIVLWTHEANLITMNQEEFRSIAQHAMHIKTSTSWPNWSTDWRRMTLNLPIPDHFGAYVHRCNCWRRHGTDQIDSTYCPFQLITPHFTESTTRRFFRPPLRRERCSVSIYTWLLVAFNLHFRPKAHMVNVMAAAFAYRFCRTTNGIL